ncbi:MAG: DUF3750 domain-containing protein [Alphaproteobacteria bacterium]|nr:DUF3750 domain-containing protein [Alphaproteobacteria bacterium]
MSWLLWIGVALLAAPAIAWVLHVPPAVPWHEASRQPAGLAPDPQIHREPVVQAYAARLYGQRGAIGAHTWIAVKPRDAAEYTVLEVTGWRHWSGRDALNVQPSVPDRYWFGNRPELLADLRGPGVEKIIDDILVAAESYPFAASYELWPGPNSNTFTAHIARAVPALRLELPPTAIGKDYLGPGIQLAPSPSNTGWQLSLAGFLALMAGWEEGLEVSLFGLTYGVDPLDLAVKLPGLGRLGRPAVLIQR